MNSEEQLQAQKQGFLHYLFDLGTNAQKLGIPLETCIEMLRMGYITAGGTQQPVAQQTLPPKTRPLSPTQKRVCDPSRAMSGGRRVMSPHLRRRTSTNTNTRQQEKVGANPSLEGSRAVPKAETKRFTQPGEGALCFFKKTIDGLKLNPKTGKNRTWVQAQKYLYAKNDKGISRWEWLLQDSKELGSLEHEGKLGDLAVEVSDLSAVIYSVGEEITPLGWLEELVRLKYVDLTGKKKEYKPVKHHPELPKGDDGEGKEPTDGPKENTEEQTGGQEGDEHDC